MHMTTKSWPLAATIALGFACGSAEGPSQPEAAGDRMPVAPDPIEEAPDIVPLTAPRPAISGGHLAASPDGDWLVGADPDRSLIYVVDRASFEEPAVIPVASETELGRVVVDDTRAFVAERNRHAIAVVELAAGRLVTEFATCIEPRGLALDGPNLHVACASGELWTHDLDDFAPVRRIELEPDLRDAVVTEEGLFVSVFRAARILQLDDAGAVTAEHAIRLAPEEFEDLVPAARVAWRMRALPDGSLMVLHQFATRATIRIAPPSAPASSSGGYGGGTTAGSEPRIAPGMLPCTNSVVASALSLIVPGEEPRVVGLLGQAAFVVDFDHDPVSGRVVVAMPSPTRQNFSPTSGLLTFELAPAEPGQPAQPGDVAGLRCLPPTTLRWSSGSGVPSTLFGPEGEQYALTRSPATLVRLTQEHSVRGLALDGSDVRHIGHDVFHEVTGSRAACASCHPEGRDDAHTWTFSGLGPRRSQSLLGGLGSTAPYHWDGEFEDLSALTAEVFTRRMSGRQLNAEQNRELLAWLDSLPPMAVPAPHDAASVERGRTLFEAACGHCHADARLGGPGSFDVGTGGAFQVPSLEGLRYRFPVMHDGCASDIQTRFDAACGGFDHGVTVGLSDQDHEDLASFMMAH